MTDRDERRVGTRMVEFTCAWCGVKFETVYRSEHKDISIPRYHSRACSNYGTRTYSGVCTVVLTCAYCGKQFPRKYSVRDADVTKPRYCSPKCSTRGVAGPVADRFWKNVDKGADDASCCWLWVGRTNQNGYGSFRLRGKNWPAHRYSYTMQYGEIEKGINACHKCDVRKCVRPDHLFPGTHKINMDDMKSKGRQNKALGENHGSAKLTNEQAQELINLRASDPKRWICKELGKKFGISASAASHIITGRAYKFLNRDCLNKKTGTQD